MDGRTHIPRRDPEEILFHPARKNALLEFEDHLVKSSDLARALWYATYSEMGIDAEAIRALADSCADHASAALYAWLEQDKNKGGEK